MEPILPPHVGQKRMLNVVRQAMLDEKDRTRQASPGRVAGGVAKGEGMTKKAEVDLLIFDLDGTSSSRSGTLPRASI